RLDGPHPARAVLEDEIVVLEGRDRRIEDLVVPRVVPHAVPDLLPLLHPPQGDRVDQVRGARWNGKGGAPGAAAPDLGRGTKTARSRPGRDRVGGIAPGCPRIAMRGGSW